MLFTIRRNGQVVKTVDYKNKLRNPKTKENQAWMRGVKR